MLQSSQPDVKEFKSTIRARYESPIENLAFVIENWSPERFSVTLDGKELTPKEDYEYGYRHELDASNLILWIRKQSTEPFELMIKEKS